MSDRKFKKGDMVRINDMQKTKIHFGVNLKMKDMIGKIYSIQTIFSDNTAIINGWNWRLEDVTLASEIESIKIKPQLFDINDLVI